METLKERDIIENRLTSAGMVARIEMDRLKNNKIFRYYFNGPYISNPVAVFKDDYEMTKFLTVIAEQELELIYDEILTTGFSNLNSVIRKELPDKDYTMLFNCLKRQSKPILFKDEHRLTKLFISNRLVNYNTEYKEATRELNKDFIKMIDKILENYGVFVGNTKEINTYVEKNTYELLMYRRLLDNTKIHKYEKPMDFRKDMLKGLIDIDRKLKGLVYLKPTHIIGEKDENKINLLKITPILRKYIEVYASKERMYDYFLNHMGNHEIVEDTEDFRYLQNYKDLVLKLDMLGYKKYVLDLETKDIRIVLQNLIYGEYNSEICHQVGEKELKYEIMLCIQELMEVIYNIKM